MSKRMWTNEQLIKAWNSSVSKAEILRKLGLTVRPGNYTTIEKYAKELNLSDDHILGRAHGTSKNPTTKSLKEILIKDSKVSQHTLKAYIIKNNILKNECQICQLEKWNDKTIILVLDHISGVNNNNRIENLRFLCPNCNSQQDTFCRRKNVKRIPRNKCTCGKEIERSSRRCTPCFAKSMRIKERPDKNTLKEEVKKNGYLKTGIKYGVSDNAIRKWLK